MVGVVVVSHMNLAVEMVATAEHIVGKFERVVAVPIALADSSETIHDRLKEAVARVDTGAGVLVLTDAFGGSATNVALPFLAEKKFEVLTGINLPILIRLQSMDRARPLDEIARELRDYGQKNILLATEMLAARRAARAKGKGRESPRGGP
ncbi:MAG: PTS sugar transporter subunit IIA [Myxococcales bacterium]|nr:PTS sugar transporter subunit IIA [Myxococcales bacterium]